MKIDDWIIRGLLGLLALAILALFATGADAVEPPEDHGNRPSFHINQDVADLEGYFNADWKEGEIWIAEFQHGGYALLSVRLDDGLPTGGMIFVVYSPDGCRIRHFSFPPSEYEDAINAFLQSENVVDYDVRSFGPGA